MTLSFVASALLPYLSLRRSRHDGTRLPMSFARPSGYAARMLSTPAVAFFEVVLALHILAVVIAFGATFAYPIFLGTVTKSDTRALPALYRAFHAISQRVIMPGLAAIVIFGIYLASHLHMWSAFYVQWGLGVSLVIGAIEGMVLGPNEKRLIAVADAELAAAGDGPVTAGSEHQALVRRVGAIGAVMDLLVVVTIYLMATHAGA
jgi:hypothetical protein